MVQAWGRRSGYAPGKDDKNHKLIHLNGDTITGLRKQLEEHTGLDQRGVAALLNGRRKSIHGWMIPETVERGYKPRFYNPIVGSNG